MSLAEGENGVGRGWAAGKCKWDVNIPGAWRSRAQKNHERGVWFGASYRVSKTWTHEVQKTSDLDLE